MAAVRVRAYVRVYVVAADEFSVQIVTDVSPPKTCRLSTQLGAARELLRTSFSQNSPCSMVIPRAGRLHLQVYSLSHFIFRVTVRVLL